MRTPYQTCKLIESTIAEIESEYGKNLQIRKRKEIMKTIRRVCKKNEINEKCIAQVMGVY